MERRPFRLLWGRLAVLGAVLMVGPGCGSQKAAPAHDLVFYQVRFDLPWRVDPAQIQESRPKPPAMGFRLTHETHTLELLDWQLKFDGKEYGAVKAGDHVRVTQEGTVIVNGDER
jgi:hypothetical protein